jgi:hypothetical protein
MVTAPVIATSPTEPSMPGTPRGVGGWLLLLVIAMTLATPLLGAAFSVACLMKVREGYSSLTALGAWPVFERAYWITFALAAAVLVWGGVGLARRRDWVVVERAKMILWIGWPLGIWIQGMVIPLFAFGRADPFHSLFIGPFVLSVLCAAAWSAYLVRSRRVRATYVRRLTV